ncbi:DUF4340 domain-containing protein [Caldanaerobacter subterraneus]|uniref:Uncharacterized protein DUF4340 n=2 Tax=Caldanaerobacter subterraneus TaxID=911092 RepID=A0A4R2K2Z6_9THEO|nr:DUF4340 domain-containing protein [Caldanaerobacter subterraneus]KKC29042.1 hypothetical protein CDSM653_01893 [Caldanaerobacter subterraneus subsp. pacificus DSM 12653]TCO67491.1 uncharacterized protein DUF4340 [Caldanaerobacter subterraneus]
MKIFKTTVILLLILVLLGGYYFYELKTSKPVKEDNKIFTFKKEDVASLKIEKQGKALISFQKEGNDWYITSPVSYKADSIYVDELLDNLTSLTFDRKLEGDLFTYGLEKPSYVVEGRLKNGYTYSLMIGNKSPVKENYMEGYYIRTDKSNEIYRVNASSIENFFLTDNYLYKYMEKFVVTVPKNEIKKLVFYENGKEFQFKKDEKGNWQLDGKTLKQEEMDNLLDSIVLLQINGLDEGKNVVSADRPFAFDVYGKDKVERISFAKKDENNEYVLIDGKSIGQYVSLKDINSIKNNLDKLIK